ncbi:AMP-binding protein [Labedaea rhizosphaerae]|uniref:Phenylacetate-CoA ligase n=1 Tax=Labedaea rhizosphaerae TaxID=598644 RepID=A0A4R6RSY6_LABRH|nr:AMP-binding protein [Labedaea rhizosphaerae]TDP90009.1 phenylacetate-CoA ligase [Labedaea rhizosphaerae]
MRPDYPVPDYQPMAATALTDAERWPALDPAARARIERLRTHPRAPRYNHECGDRLSPAAVASLLDYRARLADPVSWHPGEPPAWVGELVERVHETVPRYRRARPRSFAELTPMTRNDLLSRVDEHVPDDAGLSDLIVYRTSGSRGPAATVPMTPEFCALDLPVLQHVLAQLGVAFDGSGEVALVNVYHQPVAYQFASASAYLGGAGLLKVNLHEPGWRTPGDVVAFLDDCAPQVVSGNPISLARLAELPLTHRPRAVVSGAMGLGRGLADRLATRFGCPVVDVYGITEAGLIAWRADSGDHRLLPRRLYVEILDAEGNPCPPGVRGEIVVTCDENPLLPLLRYRTGDQAALEERDDGLVLVDLEGRDPVRFRAHDSSWVNSIELTHVLSPLGLAAWQLHQDADSSVTLTLHQVDAPPAAAAVRSLLGDVPLRVVVADLAGDAKPQRYTSDLLGALVD